MSSDFDAPEEGYCYFCETYCDNGEFCYGCEEFVCADCDETEVWGQHDVEEHRADFDEDF